jgi:hypothetical protein
VRISRAKRILRGELHAGTAALEAVRRARVTLGRRNERAELDKLNRQPARLTKEFANLPTSELLAHFRSREARFFAGFTDLDKTRELQQKLFAKQADRLLREANAIADRHCWKLLGFDEQCFGMPDIHWHSDPLSGFEWPLEYHADINLMRRDGSDARVVWELNRLAQLLALGRAYALASDERFAAEFFRQVLSWRAQNPVALGVNWNCAMEVALRATNLLGAFLLFLPSVQMTEDALVQLLTMFDQHGAHIQRNLEFSHIATSNHYLCDVTGLLWLGLLLPELQAATEWRDFGLNELLSEMDKQVLADGADYEMSTAYHRLKVELFLYSFLLCRQNGIQIEKRYWDKLYAMIDYVRAYLRPDGTAPLIGDSDSGQVFPIARRRGDDHSYLVALGAAIFEDSRLKLPNVPIAEEMLWIIGPNGIDTYESLREGDWPKSQAFRDAGIYILREDDLYLHFNGSGIGVNGRGSHGHNDKLSIEVSVGKSQFIVDPGTFVYTADLRARQLFRSTAYHSTVQVDATEQNTTDEAMPFIIGDEAHPRVVEWEPAENSDNVTAEHHGYGRLAGSVTHRRRVVFDKQNRCWFVNDKLSGEGSHELRFRFHFAPEIEVSIHDDATVQARNRANGTRLFIIASQGCTKPWGAEIEPQFCSRDYGAKESSTTVCWKVQAKLPCETRFSLIPVTAEDDEAQRMSLVLNSAS